MEEEPSPAREPLQIGSMWLRMARCLTLLLYQTLTIFSNSVAHTRSVSPSGTVWICGARGGLATDSRGCVGDAPSRAAPQACRAAMGGVTPILSH